MTHVLDPLIRYLDQKPTEGCACKICEGCREGLRILRAERDGPSARGREIESRARDAAAREVAGHRAAGREVYGRPVLARLEEARAEGRREERERVVAHLRSMARVAFRSLGREVYAGSLDGVADVTERGDHWRGGEG